MKSALDGSGPVVLRDKLDNPNGVTVINDLVSWQRSWTLIDSLVHTYFSDISWKMTCKRFIVCWRRCM